MHTGDLVVLRQTDRYEPGDIVAFEIPEGGLVIHRVTERTANGYRFQGDNRNTTDPWTLPASAIKGRRILLIPQAARALSFLGRPVTLAVLVAALVILARSELAAPTRDSSGDLRTQLRSVARLVRPGQPTHRAMR